MSEVFLCETGQLTPAARRELKRAGIVVVEVEDPARCQFIRATMTVSADDMLWAAVRALKYSDGSYGGDSAAAAARDQFSLIVIELIEAAHAQKANPP